MADMKVNGCPSTDGLKWNEPLLRPYFERHLQDNSLSVSDWHDIHVEPEAANVFRRAALEMAAPPWHDFTLPQKFNFGSRLTGQHIGAAIREDGLEHHGFLILDPGRFEVVVWIDNDYWETKTIWRGDVDAFRHEAVTLALMEGEHWTHL